MGPDGPVALQMKSIDKGMDDYHVDQDERIEFSMTVRKIAHIIFSAQAEERVEKMQQKMKK
jgi:hypothetical protein